VETRVRNEHCGKPGRSPGTINCNLEVLNELYRRGLQDIKTTKRGGRAVAKGERKNYSRVQEVTPRDPNVMQTKTKEIWEIRGKDNTLIEQWKRG